MAHPEVLLLPVMMLADYYLTVLSAALAARKYQEHFRTQHYELNPIWQPDIGRKRWLNPRHIALTVLLSAASALVVQFPGMPEPLVQGFLGATFTASGLVLGRHLSNLLVFRHVIRRPGDVSGEVTMSHPFVVALSLYQCLGLSVPIVLIAVSSGSWFAHGGTLGVVLVVGIHLEWLRRARRGQAPPGPGLQKAA